VIAVRCVGSPLGPLTLTAEDGMLIGLRFGARAPAGASCPVLAEAELQLAAYFSHRLQAFDLPLALHGPDFQRAVWEAMLRIPYGHSLTYGEIAQMTGAGDNTGSLATGARAVGVACGSNPIAIIVPCHRVVGAGGRMTGYSGGKGVATKAWLLRHEGWRPPHVPQGQMELFGS